jgi:hypothetical protein
MDGKTREKEEEATIRQTEMLCHFPVVAQQFSHDETLIDQNPEALAAFGAPLHALPREISVQSEKSHPNRNQRVCPITTLNDEAI